MSDIQYRPRGGRSEYQVAEGFYGMKPIKDAEKKAFDRAYRAWAIRTGRRFELENNFNRFRFGKETE